METPKEQRHAGSSLTACSASLAHDSAKATDEILSAEITAAVGEGWMIADLRGRLQSVRVRDEPQETITLDGKPLVELWPVELETVNEGGKITIKATRRYRTFRPQNNSASLPPVLDACCGPRMMWVNKQDPRAIYFDKRSVDYEIKPNAAYPNGTTLKIRPDVQGDFTNLPFPDESFRLVVLDPPHFTELSGNSLLGKTYSKLFPDWEDELRAGFSECFRVLKPEGVLIFKWCSVQIPLERVLALAPHAPLFGHNTGHRAQTHWMTFMKPNK